jgi:hypothetical protein
LSNGCKDAEQTLLSVQGVVMNWNELDEKILTVITQYSIAENVVPKLRQIVFDAVFKKLQKYKYCVKDLFVKTKVDEYVLREDICKLLDTKK